MTESGPIAVREGDLVAGKYRIEGVIGIGGMGVVVAARHEQLDQRVAIKLVHGTALRNDEAVQRFLREARAAARLKSEHAARVLDVGTLESGVPYMVMEFLDGSDLGKVLEQRGPLPTEIAAEWVAQACEALAEAHAAGIVHRDLKPQNLFLARTVGGTPRVKVLDFGVSKSIETMTSGPGALTRTRAMLGSPLYMAPEQMRSSRDVDARVDVWALGVVLFELLTQRWPFEADTLPELCLKVVTDPPRLLSELRTNVPEAMVRVIDRCLEKDKEKRFANAAELASALEPLMPPGSRVVVERARLAMMSQQRQAPPDGSGIGVRQVGMQGGRVPVRTTPTPASWGSKLAPSKGRGPFLWIGAIALILAITAGAALVWSGRRSDMSSPATASPSVGGGATMQARVQADPA
ncbi:MAG: serine/threonine protein kinase, partial [Myxococcota bacterium]|nr:serine/threonine protein kinase [Myxococcota bacterium]